MWRRGWITKDILPPPRLPEDLALKSRAFYRPREFTAVLIRAVYIPPQANAKQALEERHTAMSSRGGRFQPFRLECSAP